ncbi:hypothetical protein TMES_11885 [Thalassospira mesophila]|uniref:Lipoprotein n=2 Tax=Thalassospira mesophila TaxID=1293891 RepID=A0A1Y2L2B6_9PROT|nr:hypothetical protein TMES_11885 [Thalassospira mesophila]
MMNVRFLAVMVLVFAVAACGQLPRPFEGAGREGDPQLLDVPDAATVKVDIADDLPQGAARHLARAMVRALRADDIAAYSEDPSKGTYVLHPNVISRLDDTREAHLDVTWVLYNDAGLAIDSANNTGKITAQSWFADAPQAPEDGDMNIPPDIARKLARLSPGGEKESPAEREFDQLVAAPAVWVVGKISGERQTMVMAKPLKVALVDFEGAPGDGNEALNRSAKAFLQAKGITVSKEIDPQSIVLSATINVQPIVRSTGPELDRVTIDWVLLDDSGHELGQMTQDNAVPHGKLDKRWGTIASLAAQAAVDALEGALGQIARDRGLLLRADKQHR